MNRKQFLQLGIGGVEVAALPRALKKQPHLCLNHRILRATLPSGKQMKNNTNITKSKLTAISRACYREVENGDRRIYVQAFPETIEKLPIYEQHKYGLGKQEVSFIYHWNILDKTKICDILSLQKSYKEFDRCFSMMVDVEWFYKEYKILYGYEEKDARIGLYAFMKYTSMNIGPKLTFLFYYNMDQFCVISLCHNVHIPPDRFFIKNSIKNFVY